jgi:ribonuclease P protein subunit RPR2
MARAKERGEQRDIAFERVQMLFHQADSLACGGDVESASARMRQARSICLKCNVRLPRELKMRFCRRCMTYFTSGTVQCRLDSENRRLALKCLRCGHTAYQPYAKK